MLECPEMTYKSHERPFVDLKSHYVFNMNLGYAYYGQSAFFVYDKIGHVVMGEVSLGEENVS